MSLASVSCDVRWLRALCQDLGIPQEGATPIYEDKTGAIAWASDMGNFKHNKHIDVRAHYVHELVDNGEINITHVTTDVKRADTLTKPLYSPGFIAGSAALSVRARVGPSRSN